MADVSCLTRNSLLVITSCLLLVFTFVNIDIILGTPQNNITDNLQSNESITIPAVCNDGEECLPQIYVSIPNNQTQLKDLSPAELANFTDSYIKDFDSYVGLSLKKIRLMPPGTVEPSDYCDTAEPPGCWGIKKFDRNIP